MCVEVAQHVEDGLEPEVLHVALPTLVQRQTQVLQAQGPVGELGELPPSAREDLLITENCHFFPAWLGGSPAVECLLQNPTRCSPRRSVPS